MIKKIASVQHPLVKHMVRLSADTSYRKEHRHVLIEGYKSVAEICKERPALRLLVGDPKSIPEGVQAADIYEVTSEVIKKISHLKQPEEIIAEVPCPEWADLHGKKWILALDQVSDPGNMGTLLRTALALGWEGVFIFDNSVDPFNEKVLRASMGAVFRLPLMKGSWEDLESLAKKEDLAIMVADMHGTPIDQAAIQGGRILVLSNEARGVSEPADDHLKVSIPMPGEMESLNVAIAGGILMYL
jgi:TrmH family RNA methyltransferase